MTETGRTEEKAIQWWKMERLIIILSSPERELGSPDIQSAGALLGGTSDEELRRHQRRQARLDSFVRWTACIENASRAWFGERDFERMMRCLATLGDEVREDRNQTFAVEGGVRDRLETVMEMLQQVELRGQGSAGGRFKGQGGEVAGDSETVQEAWQGLYEVFKGMRREIGKMG